MEDKLLILFEHLATSIVPVAMDKYTFEILLTKFPTLASWLIDNNLAGHAELFYMGIYGAILLLVIYISTNSFNQYVALIAMLTWAIVNTMQNTIFLGGMLWAANLYFLSQS